MEAQFTTAAELEAARGDVEREFSTNRHNIETQYTQDKHDLEEAYLKDIRDNEQARREALVVAGLNPDGSDPQGRPQGSAV